MPTDKYMHHQVLRMCQASRPDDLSDKQASIAAVCGWANKQITFLLNDVFDQTIANVCSRNFTYVADFADFWKEILVST